MKKLFLFDIALTLISWSMFAHNAIKPSILFMDPYVVYRASNLMELNDSYSKSYNHVVQKIHAKAQQIAKKRGAYAVLRITDIHGDQDGASPYIDPQSDITMQIINELNAEYIKQKTG